MSYPSTDLRAADIAELGAGRYGRVAGRAFGGRGLGRRGAALVAELGAGREFLAAAGTDGVMHFAFAAALRLAVATAILAADGFVLEAFFCVKLLFSACENEFLSAIAAHQ